MPDPTHLRYDDPDSWLVDLERSTHRLGPKHGTPVDEDDQPVEPSVPDADQGAKGTPPGGRPKPTVDAWLMMVTDEGRGEYTGDPRDYESYGS